MKKKIAFLLSLVMVLTSLPLSAFGATSYADFLVNPSEKPSLELVLMEYKEGFTEAKSGPKTVLKKDGENYKGTDLAVAPVGDDWEAQAEDSFFVGVKLNGLSKLKAVTTDGHSMNSLAYNIQFNTTYLTPETIANTQSLMYPRLGAHEDNEAESQEKNFSYAYAISTGASAVSDNNVHIQLDLASTDYYSSYAYPKGTDVTNYTDSVYVGLIKFTVKSVPEGGLADAIKFTTTLDTACINFGAMGNDGAFNYYSDTSESKNDPTNMKNVFVFNDDDMTNLFPAPAAAKPALSGTPTISGTAAYGEELTASGSFTAGSDAATGVTYTWYDGTTVLGTGASYTVGKGLVGKTLTVKVTASNASGEVTATTAEVVAKEVALSGGWTVADKVFDNTTNATATAPTISNKVDSDDKVSVTGTAAFTDVIAKDNATVNITNIALTGEDAANYKLSDTDKADTTATAKITAKALTLAADQTKSGKVNTDIALSGAVKVVGAIEGTDPTVTYTYALKNAGDTGFTASGDITTVNAPNAGTVVITATATVGNTNYSLDDDTLDFNVVVSDKTVTAVAIATEPTNSEYTVGDTIDLSGIKVNVTYDEEEPVEMTLAEFLAAGGSFKIGDTTVTSGTTTVTDAMSGKKITAAIGDKTADTTTTLTVNQPTLVVSVETQGEAAERQYDGTTGNVTWTTEPEFKTNIEGKTVDTTNAVYTYAQANVGEDIQITVSGLTVDGAAVTVSGAVGKGNITRKVLTVTAKDSVKTKNSSKVSDFITVAGLVGNDTVAGLFDADTWTNGTANDKGVTLTIKTTGETPANAEIPLAKGDYTLDLSINATAFEDTNDNYTVTDPAISNAELKATKASSGGGGGGGATVTTTNYTVTFKAGTNGEFAKNATTSVKVEKDSTLASKDIPSVTAKNGYKFIGWSLDGKTVVDPTEQKVTKAVTYTALYKENLGDHTAYMNGNENGMFMPDANITRAEAAALLGRLVPTYNKENTYTGSFSDLTGDEWYANEVFFDVKNGYITGYEDGTFKPSNNITRQEFAIIVARYLGMENEGNSSFADCDGVYAEGYISQLVAKGYINGYEDGTFRPNAYITRAEATKVLNGAFDRVPDAATIDEAVSKYNVSLKDVSKRHWAYYEILEAAIDHEIGDFHK